MRALVLKAPNTPFELTTVPDPSAGPGEAVAKVFACGSGLTIQHVKAGRIKAAFPLVIGHEIAGEIVEVGAGVEGLTVGDPVTCHFYLYCGHCRWCLSGFEPLCESLKGLVGRVCDGGYAEYVKLPARNFIRLPDGLDVKGKAAEIGVIVDALTTPYKVLKRARVARGEWVAVFGAGGGLGIHQVMLARWAGARVIAVDVAADKFAACREAGAEATVDASKGNVVEALMDHTSGRGVDVAIDYVSATATLEAAVGALARHGRMVTLGGSGQRFQLNAMDLLNKEADILGSRYVSRAEIMEVYDLAARGEVWPLVTDVRPMEEAEALHDAIERQAVTGRAALQIAI